MKGEFVPCGEQDASVARLLGSSVKSSVGGKELSCSVVTETVDSCVSEQGRNVVS